MAYIGVELGEFVTVSRIPYDIYMYAYARFQSLPSIIYGLPYLSSQHLLVGQQLLAIGWWSRSI